MLHEIIICYCGSLKQIAAALSLFFFFPGAAQICSDL